MAENIRRNNSQVCYHKDKQMKVNKNILSIYGRDNIGDGVNQLDQICI